MLEARIRDEQFRMLYAQSLPILVAHVFNAAVIVGTLWRGGSNVAFSAWAGVLVGFTALRFVVWQGLGPKHPNTPGQRVLVVAAAAISGMIWGASSIVLLTPGDLLSEILIPVCVAGMGAAAAGTVACYFPAFLAFFLPAMLPLALRYFLLGDTVHFGLAWVAISFICVLLITAYRTSRALRETLYLRFEREQLSETLAATRSALEASNRSLEERVAERTAKLAAQEEALHEARRSEALGRLAGGIAHDFNNLLTIIIGNADGLKEQPRLPPLAHAALAELRTAALRGADLVRQLLAFARRQRLEPRPVELGAALRRVEPLLGRLLGGHVEVRLELDQEATWVNVDPTQLEQVVFNLASNARDAMPEGGVLTFRVSRQTLSRGQAFVEHAVLHVQDTGTGMAKETLTHAFEPFFTTKPQGRGIGLGLATVHGIVEQSGGVVQVESTVGEGTCFRVALPLLSPDEASLEEPAAPQGDAAAARILVAEDEPAVRSVVIRTLRTAGHTVFAAEDGERALMLASHECGSLDLLLTDVIMPRCGGPELARSLWRTRPQLPVVFMSGYTWEDISADPSGRSSFLPKPFSSEQLLAVVSTALRAARGRSGFTQQVPSSERKQA